ncbi:MAG: YwiC-like family protein [Actinomycetia bacterium]|nr:YwiC-like family protein [Actinomycetes bacterium]
MTDLGEAPAQRSPLRSVAMPTEHGGWSLTAEPVLLGLLVAWSLPGLALGLAAMIGFMARTPLKVVLVDRFRDRWLDRSTLAARVAALELAVIAGLAAIIVAGSEGRFWLPLLVAAPLIGVELWFDMRSRSRRLIPELAGSIGMGSVATAIALADGGQVGGSIGLWCVLAARSSAAIPYVRLQIFRTYGRPHRVWHSDLAQIAAVVAVVVGWGFDAVPIAAVVAVAAASAANLVSARRDPRPAKILGMQQLAFGVAVTLVTAIAVITAGLVHP